MTASLSEALNQVRDAMWRCEDAANRQSWVECQEALTEVQARASELAAMSEDAIFADRDPVVTAP